MPETKRNRRITLARRPTGRPVPDDFRLEEVEIPELAPDQVLVEVSHLSIDAFIRTTLEDGGFHATSGLGSPITALGVGEVKDSTFAGLTPGDWVSGPLMAQTHAVMPGAMYAKIDTSIAPASAYLGLLGMTTGLTAYFGMVDVGDVREGDTVVVSGAAGAVGTVASQIARIKGARTIGIAGGPDKMAYLLDTIGLDGAIDYKGEDVGARLDELAPDGVDVFFDNVGGELLDTVLSRIRMGARVSICGAISQYDDLKDVRGPKLYLRLAERNARMGGFTVDHFMGRFPEAVANITIWMNEGRLTLPEHVEHGIERFPEALIMLFTGGHMGKLLVTP